MAALLNETDLIGRILAHIDNKTTDRDTVVWREPVENYHSAERFAEEIEVLRRVPMAFCPSLCGVSLGSRWNASNAMVRLPAGPATWTMASRAARATHMSEG